MKQNINIEAEGNELVLKNKAGDYVIIPKKYRLEVQDMIKENCHGCIDELVETLPIMEDYAQDGNIIPDWDEVESVLNPKNWGVTDYTNKGDFKTAYSAARQAGEKEFMWNNKRYNTNYKGTLQQQLKETGITDNQLHNRGRFEKNMSDNLNPVGYSPAFNGFDDAIFGKKSKERIELEQRGIENKRLDAFNLYTGVPQKNNTFSISKYKPSKSKDENTIYYSINNNKTIEYILEEGLYKDGKINISGDPKSKHLAHDGLDNVMGNYALSTGKDDRGEYISYYDKWDLEPVDFGKPFEIYDRIYVKDYADGQKKRMYYTDKELSELDIDKKNFDTLALQRELSNRGYKLPKSTKKDGTFDGVWGDETKNALLEYKKSQNKSEQ